MLEHSGQFYDVVSSKEDRRAYIRDTAPTLWNAFMELEEAERRARALFKKQYGRFWRLFVSKKRFEEKYMEIAVEMTEARLEKEWEER